MKCNFSLSKFWKGVPVIFPQFGPGKLQQHGFARNQVWSVKNTFADKEKAGIVLQLSENSETLKLWEHSFRLELEFTLTNEKLCVHFSVFNTGKNPFEFTLALHTYLKVDDIDSAKISGMKGIHFIDKLRHAQSFQEDREHITFDKETDRVYQKAPQVVHLEDKSLKVEVTKSENLSDFVVWVRDRISFNLQHFSSFNNPRILG